MAVQIFDIILIAIVILAVVLASKKGFASSLLETASVLISGVASYKFSEPVSTFVCDTFFAENANEITYAFTQIVVFIILFIVFSILLKFASKLLSSVMDKIPLVGTANSVLGGVLGFIKAVIIVYVICTLCYLIVLSDNTAEIKNIISDSYIYQFLIENNPVIDFIKEV